MKRLLNKVVNIARNNKKWSLAFLSIAIAIIVQFVLYRADSLIGTGSILLRQVCTQLALLVIGGLLVCIYIISTQEDSGENRNIAIPLIVGLVISVIFITGSYFYASKDFLSRLSSFSILFFPWLTLVFVKSVSNIPSLIYKPIYIESIEDQRGKKFQGKSGIIWLFENIGEEPYEYRLRVDQRRLSESVTELFTAVVAHQILNKENVHHIPLRYDDETLGWRLEIDNRLSLNRLREPLDPMSRLSKSFWFFNPLLNSHEREIKASAKLKGIRTIYVNCVTRK